MRFSHVELSFRTNDAIAKEVLQGERGDIVAAEAQFDVKIRMLHGSHILERFCIGLSAAHQVWFSLRLSTANFQLSL